jgi:NAD-dependent dihydropyrimidine dehydrogenase PreA subunit
MTNPPVEIDPDNCVLCGLCTGVCPPNALRLDPTALLVLDNCTGCGWCVPYCPVGAIHGGRRAARRTTPG